MKPSVSRLGVDLELWFAAASERFRRPKGLVSPKGLVKSPKGLEKSERDAYQLEVEKCVCAAARFAALWPWTTRVVAVTGKIRRVFINHCGQVRVCGLSVLALLKCRANKDGELTSVASVIWSSGQAHSVDALAAEGDEGRGSLR